MPEKKTRIPVAKGPWAPENRSMVELVYRLIDDAKDFPFVQERLGVGSPKSGDLKVDIKSIKDEIGIDDAALSRWATGSERDDRNPDQKETNNKLLKFFSGDFSWQKPLSKDFDYDRQDFCNSLLEHWNGVNAETLPLLRQLLDEHGEWLERKKLKLRAQTLEEITNRAKRDASQALSDNKWRLDLWAPGRNAETIIGILGEKIDNATSRRLEALSSEAIAAIGRGDFIGQLEVADRVIDLGKDAPGTPLMGEGYYLKAEAMRLLADFDTDYGQQNIMREEAAQLFGLAVDELRGDPRAVRGLARTHESLGELGPAQLGYKRAYLDLEGKDLDKHSSVQHLYRFEYIRTLRHKVYNLATIHLQSVGIGPSKNIRAAELQHLVLKSEEQHRIELGQCLDFDKNWIGIEKFASAVMHAKAWLALGETEIAADRMCVALKARIEMMEKKGTPTVVEAVNFDWWMASARTVESGFASTQREALAVLFTCIQTSNDRTLLHDAALNLLRNWRCR